MRNFLLFVNWANESLNRIALLIMLPALSLMVTVSVLMRYIVSRPILGSDEICGILFSLLIFFSLAHCWMTDGHVRTEILISRMGKRLRRILDLVADLNGFVFSLVLSGALFLETQNYIHTNQLSMDACIPMWPFVGLGFLGSFIFSLCTLSSLISKLGYFGTERR